MCFLFLFLLSLRILYKLPIGEEKNMRHALPFMILATILLMACASPPLQDGAPPEPSVISAGDGLRPDIPRSQNPGEQEPTNPDKQTGHTPRDFLTNSTTRVGSPGVNLDIPLNEPIGKYHPILRVEDFPLLRHNTITITPGEILTYDEEILFDFRENSTGKIIFGKDDETEQIGTFLFFAEDKPIFEYRLRLQRGTFRDIQGRNIQILGHTYVVADVTEKTVNFYGKDIASNLGFTNGSKLLVNSSKRSNTDVRVWPNMIAFRVLGDDIDDDGILLSPGESLSDNLGWTPLASKILDIRYLGTPNQTASLVYLNKKSFGYELEIDVAGGRLSLPLVEEDAGKLFLGSPDGSLRITPCPSGQQYCIPPETQLLLTSSRGRTFVIEYIDASNDTKELIMRSKGNRYSFEFLGEPGRDAWTDIVLDGEKFRARIGPKGPDGEYNISVDQGFRQGRVEIVTADGSLLRIHDFTNGNKTLPLEIITKNPLARHGEEQTFLNITFDGLWTVTAGGNLTFTQEENDGDDVGISRFGTGVFLDKKDRNLPEGVGEDVVLLIPWHMVRGAVRIEG